MEENNSLSGNSYSHYKFFNPRKIGRYRYFYGRVIVADLVAEPVILPYLSENGREKGKIFAIDVLPSAIEIVTVRLNQKV